MDSETISTSFRILMFPWLAHGHIFPYLELAKRILKRKKFHIYFCSAAINLSSIKHFIEQNSLGNSIELVELHIPPSPELPPHYHTTKNLPLNLKSTLHKAFQTSKSSFSNIISNLKPDLVIYDIFQPWAAKIASSKGIPAVHFAAFGAASVSYFHHYNRSDDDFPFQDLSLSEHEMRSSDGFFTFLQANVFDEDRDLFMVNYKLSCDVALLKTTRGFEGKYIDYVSRVCGKKVLTVGPLVTDVNKNDDDDQNSEIMQWLSKKNPRSTVYISFGSECFLSIDEIREIAKGLELCDSVNFIWVIRFPIEDKRISVEEALPEGFLERVKERGLVLSGWAPQAKILSHESVGAFISHCGWSSLTESVYFGVPVIGIPMRRVMIIDARVLVNEGVCVEVQRNDNESRAFNGEEIARAINKVILDKSSGEGFRLRARELSEKMKNEEEEELDETAEQLWQICLKND